MHVKPCTLTPLSSPGSAGLQLHLASLRRTAPDTLAAGPEYEGNVIVHPSAKIGKDCKIGPNVSIGIGCELENGVRVSNAVLLHRVKVRCCMSAASHPLRAQLLPRAEDLVPLVEGGCLGSLCWRDYILLL